LCVMECIAPICLRDTEASRRHSGNQNSRQTEAVRVRTVSRCLCSALGPWHAMVAQPACRGTFPTHRWAISRTLLADVRVLLPIPCLHFTNSLSSSSNSL
ncbi:hypothetical protein HAX54_029022, partial [Datura stramonium]|nr:hypothetical protein [Datura stramonium]